VLKGIREDEDAVRSLGKNVYSYKMQSLVLGGVIGAVAGILYVLPRAVQPDSMGRSMTFFVWTILLLGGAATVFGPVLGSIIFWAVLAFIKITMREVVPTTVLRNEQIEQFGWIIVGVTLMLLIIFRPQGILGDKKELAINAH
jgi:branched-chain amino acid transport system permease protein